MLLAILKAVSNCIESERPAVDASKNPNTNLLFFEISFAIACNGSSFKCENFPLQKSSKDEHIYFSLCLPLENSTCNPKSFLFLSLISLLSHQP